MISRPYLKLIEYYNKYIPVIGDWVVSFFSRLCFLSMVLWFFLTIVVNIPSTYIRESELYSIYNKNPFLYQKWSFFSPPPTFNSTVIIETYAGENFIKAYDIYKVVLDNKKEVSNLSNSNYTFLDYYISSVINNISNYIFDRFRRSNITMETGDKNVDKTIVKEVEEKFKQPLEFINLFFKKYILKENPSILEGFESPSIRICIKQESIKPSFRDKFGYTKNNYNETKPNKDSYLFKSNPIYVNP